MINTGPKLVCAGCGAETTLFKPICDNCLRACGQVPQTEAALIARENRRRIDKEQSPTSIIVELPAELAAHLAPHFDWCIHEAKRGAMGMFLAQAWRNDDGRAFLRAGFIPHKHALRLRELMKPSVAEVLTAPAESVDPEPDGGPSE